MIEHRGPISGVASHAAWVATAGYDNQVVLWDAQRQVARARGFHDHLANQCRFSPCGRWLVSASSDYSARVWSIPDLRLHSVLVGHDDDVEMAAFSPDCSRVATASRDHTLRVFTLDGGAQVTLRGHTADVISVEWRPDGRELVSSSDDGTVRRWSPDGRELGAIDLGGVETDTVVCAEDGALYVGTDLGEIVVIAGGTVHKVAAHRAGIKRLVYDARSRRLVSAGYDREVKIWSIGHGTLDLSRRSEAPACVWLRSCAFMGADALVFGTFGSSYATLRLATGEWDLAAVADTPGINAVRSVGDAVFTVGDAGVVHVDGEPTARLGSLCNFLLPWRDRVLTGGHLGVLFDARTGASLYRHTAPLNCGTTFTREGEEHCVIGAYDGVGLVFRAGEDGAPRLVTSLRLHDNAVKGVASDGRRIFSVCATGAATFHAAATLERVRTIARAHDRISNGAACLPDGRFVSISRDRKLRLWSGEEAAVMATPHTHSVKCVAVCPATGAVATGSYSGTVAIYDVQRGAWTTVVRPTAAGISSITATHVPRRFIAGSYDGRTYVVQ